MPEAMVEPNVVAYAAASSACETGEKLHQLVSLLDAIEHGAFSQLLRHRAFIHSEHEKSELAK